MVKVAFLGLDVHAGNSVLGSMDGRGGFRGNVAFSTSEANIVKAVKAVPARKKYLVLEEGTLARWAAQVARPYVTEVLISDPRENALIYKSGRKKDKVDTKKLCRLARLGEVKCVYHAQTDDRAIFKTAVQHYQSVRQQQVTVKSKIKAKYRYWGIVDVGGQLVYGKKGRQQYLEQVEHLAVRIQLNHLYTIMDEAVRMQELAFKQVKELGRSYPEIREFKKIPGIGEVGAHVFDAYVQTPDRFPGKRELWCYSRLGIQEHTSDGKPLGYQRLDRAGVGELKDLSYKAWQTSMGKENEVHEFYRLSLKATHNHTHARLNTQRKILAVMLAVWRKGDRYRPELFLGSSN
jgi:transposase